MRPASHPRSWRRPDLDRAGGLPQRELIIGAATKARRAMPIARVCLSNHLFRALGAFRVAAELPDIDQLHAAVLGGFGISAVEQLLLAEANGLDPLRSDSEGVDQRRANGLGAPVAQFEIVFSASS